MEFSISQVASIIGGEVDGDGAEMVSKLSKIEEAEKGSISFLANMKYESFIYSTNASAVIVSKEFEPKSEISSALIKVEDPYTSFSALLEEYYRIQSFSKKGIEEPSYVGDNTTTGSDIYRGAFSYIGHNVRLGNNVKIYPQAYIGDNVSIGDNTIIYSGVKIYANCQVGSHCVIHSGAVVGSDGFGFAPQPDGTYKTIPQVGNVIIEDFVDIGANTVIDCATMDSTIIKKGVKLDNLIQVAHNVEIGSNTVIAAQSGVSGSSKIGSNCMIAGQVGIAGHLKIASNTKIGAQSGISGTIKEDGKTVMGSPAFDLKKFYRSYAHFRRLPQVMEKMAELEQKILDLPTFKN